MRISSARYASFRLLHFKRARDAKALQTGLHRKDTDAIFVKTCIRFKLSAKNFRPTRMIAETRTETRTDDEVPGKESDNGARDGGGGSGMGVKYWLLKYPVKFL